MKMQAKTEVTAVNDDLFDNMKVGAYLIWERVQGEGALNFWHCTEEIAGFLKCRSLFDLNSIKAVIKKDVFDVEYIDFVRNISYRLYLYTHRNDAIVNWFDSEQLLRNDEWVSAVTRVAKELQ